MHIPMSRQIDSADHRGRLSGWESGATGCDGRKVVRWLKGALGNVRIRRGRLARFGTCAPAVRDSFEALDPLFVAGGVALHVVKSLLRRGRYFYMPPYSPK